MISALFTCQPEEKEIKIEQDPRPSRYTYNPTYPEPYRTASLSSFSMECNYSPIMPWNPGKCSGCAF